MALTREQILAIQDGEREEVQIPAWGGSVFVKVLSAAEKDYWEKMLQPPDGAEATNQQKLDARYDNLRARTAVLATCDEQGMPLFTFADAEWLGSKSGKALDKIWEVFVRLNELGKDEIEALKKNSVPTLPIASGSILPLPSADAPLPNGDAA